MSPSERVYQKGPINNGIRAGLLQITPFTQYRKHNLECYDSNFKHSTRYRIAKYSTIGLIFTGIAATLYHFL